MVEVSIVAAFAAGVLSFMSPCVLPLVPAFLAYLSGISLHDLKQSRSKLFFNSLSYVIGFSSVFSVLGVLLHTMLKEASADIQPWLARIGGTIIIFFGLYLLGIFKPRFFLKERVVHVRWKSNNTYITSFVFGAAFAIGWTPCIGAVLGSVLALALTQPALSFMLLLTYSIGIGIPFLLAGLFATQALDTIRKLGPYLKYFNWIVGTLLVLLGILVFTQSLTYISTLVIF